MWEARLAMLYHIWYRRYYRNMRYTRDVSSTNTYIVTLPGFTWHGRIIWCRNFNAAYMVMFYENLSSCASRNLDLATFSVLRRDTVSRTDRVLRIFAHTGLVDNNVVEFEIPSARMHCSSGPFDSCSIYLFLPSFLVNLFLLVARILTRWRIRVDGSNKS